VELVVKAADRLKKRANSLKAHRVPLQIQILLMRFCFYPCINHLLRTLHPEVSREGAQQYDEIVLENEDSPSLRMSGLIPITI
jgi:hypothetical protein